MKNRVTNVLESREMERVGKIATDLTGAPGRRFLARAGESLDQFGLLWRVLVTLVRARGRGRQMIRPTTIEQIYFTGVQALPVISLMALLLGVLVIVESTERLSEIGLDEYLGRVMVVMIIRELGPVMTALLVILRSGVAIGIKLGYMTALREMEAIEMQGIDPLHLVAVPRIIGLMSAIVCLFIYFDLVAVFGGAAFAWLVMGRAPGPAVVGRLAGHQLPGRRHRAGQGRLLRGRHRHRLRLPGHERRPRADRRGPAGLAGRRRVPALVPGARRDHLGLLLPVSGGRWIRSFDLHHDLLPRPGAGRLRPRPRAGRGRVRGPARGARAATSRRCCSAAATLRRPARGRLAVCGRPVEFRRRERLLPLRSRIGYVGPGSALVSDLTPARATSCWATATSAGEEEADRARARAGPAAAARAAAGRQAGAAALRGAAGGHLSCASWPRGRAS